MNIHYRITGGNPLHGDVHIGGAKNAALPLLVTALLVSGKSVFHNVPDLRDIRTLLEIFEHLGATCQHDENKTVTIDTTKLQSRPIPHEMVSKLRGSIVCLGALLARFGVAEMDYPGGCFLGKRPVHAHTYGFEQMGIKDMSTNDTLHLQGKPKAGRVIMAECSVTATSNMLMAAALTEGETVIEFAACEPHVADVQRCLIEMGVEIEGVGTHTVTVRGKKELTPPNHTVISDYLETGAFTLAALLTNGKLTLHNAIEDDLLLFFDTLKRIGAQFTWNKDGSLTVDGTSGELLDATNIKTNIHPGFPTDLQAPMGVLLSQANGVSRIFERLFEGRMAYLYELEKMHAQVEILNAHQALVIGPSQLRGATVASNDIRAGAAMVLAALCASGESIITDVSYIERGYDRLDEKLRNIGADIERFEVGV